MNTKQWIIDALKKNGWNASTVTKMYDEYCSYFKKPCKKESYVRSVYLYAKDKKTSPSEVNVKEETDGDIYSALVSSTWIKTPEDLISHLGIDLNIWELGKFTRNVWGSETNPSFQVKGDFRKKKIEQNEALVLETIRALVEDYKPTESKVKTASNTSGNMLEIAIKDHHYGQLSNESETGEAYNLEIARDLYLNTVDYMLASSSHYNIEKINMVVGSDFFNSDTATGTTYAGTYQSEADRWQKTFSSGVQLVVDSIEKCKTSCNKVQVIVIQGNHDYTKSFYMGIALAQRYANDKTVNINCSETPRKYEEWGSSLICFTHGDKEVKGKLPFIISREMPQAFAMAKYIEIHTGHLHTERESLVMCSEDVTIKQRILPSLVAVDDWHKAKGYAHIRESQGFVWNKEHGNIAVLKYHA